MGVAKAVEQALAGDTTALRLCLERIAPPRKDTTVQFDLPTMETAQDTAQAAQAVLHAVSAGELTPTEGALIPADTVSKAVVPISMIGGHLTLHTDYVDFNLEAVETDYALDSFAQDVTAGLEMPIENLEMFVGCKLEMLQRFQGGIGTKTPEGEPILYQFVTTVILEDHDGDPSLMVGTFYWHGNAGLTGTYSMTLMRVD